MKAYKIAGIAVGLAIVGLSLGDALTGHGIKGNKNLNPLVVGSGSSTNTSTTSSTATSTTGDSSEKKELKEDGTCVYKSDTYGTVYGTWYDCKDGNNKECKHKCVSL